MKYRTKQLKKKKKYHYHNFNSTVTFGFGSLTFDMRCLVCGTILTKEHIKKVRAANPKKRKN